MEETLVRQAAPHVLRFAASRALRIGGDMEETLVRQAAPLIDIAFGDSLRSGDTLASSASPRLVPYVSRGWEKVG